MGYDVAIVGTGPDPHHQTTESFAMGYRHAESFGNHPDCEVVACADLHEDNARAFAEAFDLPESAAYTDTEEMLATVEPDVVGISVPPQAHADVVEECARSGVVSAIHCEKPMASSWGAAQRMAQVCWRRDVQLTFNRQRRFGKPFTRAKDLVDGGDIGDLRRVETTWGDLYDIGAHTVDLTGMFADEAEPEWVIAQIDYRDEDIVFGMHQENQSWARWEYESGVTGVIATGPGTFGDASHRLLGTGGEMRIDVDGGPMLEVRRDGEGWEAVDVDGEDLHAANDRGREYGSAYIDRAVADAVRALEEDGYTSSLDAKHGLKTAEVLFGAYESVRSRGRVEFPLEVDDNPLEAMVESGALSPRPADE